MELRTFLRRWLVTMLAVLVAVAIVPGLEYEKVTDLLAASLLLGVLNAFVRPILLRIALPLVVLSLGLFVLAINALLVYLVGQLVQGFHVAGFCAAFFGALIISVVSVAVGALPGIECTRFVFRWGRRPHNSDHDNTSGPVIDV